MISLDKWQDGYASYEEGFMLSDNPEPKDSSDFDDWEEGWIDAQTDTEGVSL